MKVGSWRTRATAATKSPFFWVLVIAAVLRLVGLGWGLPASDGWDDDGIAPRDFLVGVVNTYTPGDYYTYPPLQLILITILTAPGWIIALFKAHSFAPADVIAEFIQVPYMTFFAIVARLLSAAMSVGTIACVGKIAEELGGKRAGIFAACACALNATLTYYGHVTNLDGPYIFWSALAALQVTRAISRREVRRFRSACIYMVFAVATKDQAYAIFLLSAPAILLLWFAADRWPRKNANRVIVAVGASVLFAVVILLAVDGAITNPSGFRARMAFLLGPASQDHAYYRRDWNGRLHLLQDGWTYFTRYYPYPFAALGLAGIWIRLTEFWKHNADRARAVVGVFPLLAMVSFTLTFNFTALRTEHRFLLPQSVFFAVYVGLAADALASSSVRLLAWIGRPLLIGVALWALYFCIGVDVVLLDDPRYVAEEWLRDQVRPGDRIETYGHNVYLPRFPKNSETIRVAPTPLAGRNPLPNVTEVEAPFEDVEARHPRFIVVSAFWAWRYMMPEDLNKDNGRVYSGEQQERLRESGARKFFHDLYEGKLRYKIVADSGYVPKFWPVMRIHQSTGETIRIFERIE